MNYTVECISLCLFRFILPVISIFPLSLSLHSSDALHISSLLSQLLLLKSQSSEVSVDDSPAEKATEGSYEGENLQPFILDSLFRLSVYGPYRR